MRTAGAVTVGGMAKGAAMLAPNMATMLAVLTTDAELSPAELQRPPGGRGAGLVQRPVRRRLHVDQRHRDRPVERARGRARSPTEFGDALAAACADLAGQMAGDAEGATKVVRVRVTGAADDADAARAARKVAESQLVKCSLYGEDPYWGRVVSELGSAGRRLRPRPGRRRLRRRRRRPGRSCVPPRRGRASTRTWRGREVDRARRPRSRLGARGRSSPTT